MFIPMKTLLSPLKSVIPVTFTPNPGLFSWKFPPSPPFESTNKPAERSDFVSSAEMVLKVQDDSDEWIQS